MPTQGQCVRGWGPLAHGHPCLRDPETWLTGLHRGVGAGRESGGCSCWPPQARIPSFGLCTRPQSVSALWPGAAWSGPPGSARLPGGQGVARGAVASVRGAPERWDVVGVKGDSGGGAAWPPLCPAQEGDPGARLGCVSGRVGSLSSPVTIAALGPPRAPCLLWPGQDAPPADAPTPASVPDWEAEGQAVSRGGPCGAPSGSWRRRPTAHSRHLLRQHAGQVSGYPAGRGARSSAVRPAGLVPVRLTTPSCPHRDHSRFPSAVLPKS